MSGCSSGYIPFSLAASPFLKVVGKTMFVKWKIKGNMATLYFHSHTANHDGVSYIWMELTATENLKPETSPCLTLKATEQFTPTWTVHLHFGSLFPWTQVSKLPMKMISEHPCWGQWILTGCTFRKLFLSSKFSSSSFQERGKMQFSSFFFFFFYLLRFKRGLSFVTE